MLAGIGTVQLSSTSALIPSPPPSAPFSTTSKGNPSTLATLLTELNTTHSTYRLTLLLSVVIKKGLRIRHALGLNLECVVSASGLKFDDALLPPGTIVGVNPWIMYRDPRVIGEDAEI